MADRYLLESGAPDGFTLEDGSGVLILEGGAAPAPQRVQLWKSAALVALGFFAVDEVPAVDHDKLHSFRSPAAEASGHFLFPFNQVVLVGVEQPIYRTDHARVLVGRQTPIVVAVSQPFWIGLRAKPPAFEDEPFRAADHTRLHRYRVGYQTVGQPWFLRHTQPRLIEPETAVVLRGVDLTPFRGQYPAAPVAGQPWYLWKFAKGDQATEPDATRVNYSALFFNRSEGVIIPPVVGYEWIVRARRRKGR